jgi:hypothetical protein
MSNLTQNVEQFMQLLDKGYLPIPIDELHTKAFVKAGGSLGRKKSFGAGSHSWIKATLPPSWRIACTDSLNPTKGHMWDSLDRCRGEFYHNYSAGTGGLRLYIRYQLTRSGLDGSAYAFDLATRTRMCADSQEERVQEWLNQNFPEWHDPGAYWD